MKAIYKQLIHTKASTSSTSTLKTTYSIRTIREYLGRFSFLGEQQNQWKRALDRWSFAPKRVFWPLRAWNWVKESGDGTEQNLGKRDPVPWKVHILTEKCELWRPQQQIWEIYGCKGLWWRLSPKSLHVSCRPCGSMFMLCVLSANMELTCSFKTSHVVHRTPFYPFLFFYVFFFFFTTGLDLPFKKDTVFL